MALTLVFPPHLSHVSLTPPYALNSLETVDNAKQMSILT